MENKHEVKKYSLRQTKDGTIIGFVLHPSEILDELTTAPIGTRFEITVKQLSDDE